MNERFIIEVTDGDKRAFVTEKAGDLYLTFRRREATEFPSKLDAMCAFVYIEDRCQPRLVSCG